MVRQLLGSTTIGISTPTNIVTVAAAIRGSKNNVPMHCPASGTSSSLYLSSL